MLLKAKEVALILRVSDSTVRRWGKKGAMPIIVLSRHRTRQTYRIKSEVIDRILGE
jgi:excisionase family DNA binding protein